MMDKLKILVVEDEPMIAESLSEMLELLDHEVLSVAESGEEAVMQLMQQEPDLLLLDIQLRGKMDGVELARLIRQKYNIPFIFTTAYADEETITRAKAEGPYGYIVKPYGVKDIMAGIEVAMSNYRLFNEIKGKDPVAPMVLNDHLYLKVDQRLVKIKRGEICYAEAKGDYVLIKTLKESFVIYSTLKKVADKLSEDQFMQVHRSFVVNLEQIDEVEETSINIQKKAIPVSRANRSLLLSRLNTL
jgi:DNA-binding LytR/AlgR family response regulator